ncbi:Chitin synthase, class 3 [Rhizoclosmatium sp. JEL0117]|nr:Chitin synthase, class 3 [Rhizoclosmatium sp. JEL0117]
MSTGKVREPTLPAIDTDFLDDDESFGGPLAALRETPPLPSTSVAAPVAPGATGATGLATNAHVGPTSVAYVRREQDPTASDLTLNSSLQQQNLQNQGPFASRDRLVPVPLQSQHGTIRRKLTKRRDRRTSDAEDVFGSMSRKKKDHNAIKTNTWVYASWILTCCIPSIFINKCLKKPNPLVQQAWREKFALCFIIFILMCIVGFLTFGFQNIVCPTRNDPTIHQAYSKLRPRTDSNSIAIKGVLYTASSPDHITIYGAKIKDVIGQGNGADFGMMFPPPRGQGACAAFDNTTYPLFPCTAVLPATDTVLWPNATIVAGITNATIRANPTGPAMCHPRSDENYLSSILKWQGDVIANYSDVVQMAKQKKLMVFSGNVLDVTPFYAENSRFNASIFGAEVDALIKSHNGKDATRAFANAGLLNVGYCLTDYLKIAKVDSVSPNCFTASVVVWISTMIILLVVLAQFVLAVYFKYAIGWTLGNNKAYRRAMDDLKRRRKEYGRNAKTEEPMRTGARNQRTVPDLEGDIVPYNPHSGGAFGIGPAEPSVHTNSSNDDSTDSKLLVLQGPNGRELANIARLSQIGSNVGVRSSPIPGAFSGPRTAAYTRETARDAIDPSRNWNAQFGFMEIEGPTLDAQTSEILNDPTLMHCLCLVTCYSEGEESLKSTLNSIAHSYYPGTHKVLFVIADGIVKGSENDKTTPDILIDMIEVDERFVKEDPRLGGSPESYSYVAIADGANRKNYAKVYAGWYKYDTSPPEPITKPKRSRFANSKRNTVSNAIEMDGLQGKDDPDAVPAHMKTLKQRSEGRVPMILIVKVGNDEERNPDKPAAKPGNRGKRDSQVLLMNFLAKVMFDDRMTELEFDIFFKLFTITGVNPEKYEALLMVDADTRIYPDALSHMIACLLKDDRVMGLCGETKISNKWDSWITMIQVFEYFISHHMTKAFESVFGGCTCLPGCFSMYRIKTPKGPNGYWVPILANPDIVEEYSEHIVDTLHKKNLLLLGEDRFLSTMMLRTFPKRRMVFCPPAVCKTVVPDTFKVLLSQRRRWINSTIHNLMELLLVKDLCGTFCISMQFVIFMNLVGTVVLPAAITFTITILIMTATNVGADTEVPLILLALILGLPAVLILITANRPIYIFWMLIYLISLPIWNFALPMYAFWHFDDFSWGATRRVAGEDLTHDHSAREGEFDGKGINMKRWSEWVKLRRMEHERMEYERDPALFEQKYRSKYYSSSSESGSILQRGGSTVLSGGSTTVPVIPAGLVMPPIFADNRSSFYNHGPVPGPPPPSLIMPLLLPTQPIPAYGIPGSHPPPPPSSSNEDDM